MRGPNHRSTRLARGLRRRSTRGEWVLWLKLRDRRLGGFKFARQYPIGPYIVDFICRERRLIVEVDGGQHTNNAADHARDGYLASLGYSVVRFWNGDVLQNIEGVLVVLKSALERAPHPVPLPARGEREPGCGAAGAGG